MKAKASKIGIIYNRPLIQIEPPTPLLGHIAFGVIDRGTNILQIRPSTICPHNCIYCSVDAGPGSTTRATEYIVEPRHLYNWAVSIASEVKKEPVEMLIDGVGEPLTHPNIIRLVKMLSEDPFTWRVAIETHGGFLSKPLLRALDRAGLSRINLSLDTLNPVKARLLSGVEWYNVNKILNIIEYTIKETRIDVILTPVVIPGINENDMKSLIKLAKQLKLGEKTGWPTGILIQKYEKHKYGRKPRNIKEWTWKKFYTWLDNLEQETGYKLTPTMKELGYHRAPRVNIPYKRGQKILVKPFAPGWHKGELLTIDANATRIVSLYCDTCRIGKPVHARLVRVRDNILVARK